MGFLDIDRQQLERLALFAFDLAQHHARSGNRKLVALATHVFEQYREVQLAPPEDEEHVRVLGVLDPQRDVGKQLPGDVRAGCGW